MMNTADGMSYEEQLQNMNSDTIRQRMAQIRTTARQQGIELADDGWPIIPDKAPRRVTARMIEQALNRLDAELKRRERGI